MSVSKIRSEFPFLKRKYGRKGVSLAYLDNASTTQKPQVVIDAISDVYKNHYANIHRGVYDLSQEATEAYEEVREKVKNFIGAKDSREVIFTRNTTEAVNLLAYSLEQNLKDGDEIVLSEMEHHSNIVPWQMLKERLASRGQRLVIKYIPIDREGRLDLSRLDKLITNKTKIVSLTLMSNVLGTINPLSEIIKRARKICPGLIAIVDAAQAAAHLRLDVSNLGCDFLAFSAHKMYGPSGVGVLWGRKEILKSLPPFMGGGDMILSVTQDKTIFNELPWKFEAGTPNIADVIAFGNALDLIEKIGIEKIKAHEMELVDFVLKRLIRDRNVEVYGPIDLALRGPVIAFNIDGLHPHDVASILSGEAVAIRSGHHCAQPLMQALDEIAVCRVSFGVYNTKEEVLRLFEAIDKVKEVFDIPILQEPEALRPSEFK